MADFTTLPTATNIEVLMKSAGYWPVGATQQALATEQASIGVAGGHAELISRTGWRPFLSTSEEEEERLLLVEPRRFHSTGMVNLHGGLLRLDGISLATVAGGQSEVPLNQVYTMPADAASKSLPYTWLLFPYHKWWGGVHTPMPIEVRVTGRWGRCTVMPEDAWAAILFWAATFTLLSIENMQSVASLSMDGFSKALDIVGINTQKDAVGAWVKNFNSTCNRYKRVF